MSYYTNVIVIDSSKTVKVGVIYERDANSTLQYPATYGYAIYGYSRYGIISGAPTSPVIIDVQTPPKPKPPIMNVSYVLNRPVLFINDVPPKKPRIQNIR